MSYPLPGTKVLRDGQGAAARQDALAGQRRPGDDVPRHLQLRLLSRSARPAARAGHAVGAATCQRSRRSRPACGRRRSDAALADIPARTRAAGLRVPNRARARQLHAPHPAHPRLLSRRRREGAADHEAVSAARAAVSVRVPEAPRARRSRSTTAPSARAPELLHEAAANARRHPRHLHEPDDARLVLRDHQLRPSSRLDGDSRRARERQLHAPSIWPPAPTSIVIGEGEATLDELHRPLCRSLRPARAARRPRHRLQG